MAIRFRKRIKILPGITVNLSDSGVSTTIGTKGLSVNVGKKGTYLNTGIPGTGLYSRTRLSSPLKQDSISTISTIKFNNKGSGRNMSRVSVSLELERLAKLLEKGFLTEEEYQEQKNRVLGKSDNDDSPTMESKPVDYSYLYSRFFRNSKSRIKASLLALFLGLLGIHKFYLGKKLQGVFYILLLPTGFSVLWWIFDVIKLSLISDDDFLLNYNSKVLVDMGINPYSINRSSEVWYFLVRNNSYLTGNNIASKLFRVGVLAFLAVIVFTAIKNKDASIKVFSNNQSSEIAPVKGDIERTEIRNKTVTIKECNQISKDLYYFLKVSHICGVEQGLNDFLRTMGDGAFHNFRSENNCPSITLEQSQKDNTIVQDAIIKARNSANNDVVFCSKEKTYFNKIVNKYSPYNY